VKEPCYALAVEIRDGHQHDRADLRGRARSKEPSKG